MFVFDYLALLFFAGTTLLILIWKRKKYLNRALQLLGYCSTCVCLAAFPLYFTYCKTKKHLIAYQLNHLSSFTINSIDGYYNVHDYLRCKKMLHSLRQQKWWKKERSKKELETLRFATDQFHGVNLNTLLENPIPDWIQQLIDEEFSYYSLHPFSSVDIQTMLKEFQSFGADWEREGYLALFSIRNGTLFVKDYSNRHFRLHDVSTALDRLCMNAHLPDLDFLVSFHDHLENKPTCIPIFVFSKKSHNKKMVLIPDHEQLMGYNELNTTIDLASSRFPWNKKKDLAFWRGGTSGGIYTDSNWNHFPRAQLTLFSTEHPELLDAKFSILVQGAKIHEEFFLKHNMIAPVLYPEEQLSYRYLIDVDGNASTYSRFYWILRSNCTPIKQVSSFIQWYYPLLIPYQHYVPVKEDLSDLKEQLEWIKNHEEEARIIAETSSAFAKQYLSTEATYLYLYAALLKYKECYSFNTEKEQ